MASRRQAHCAGCGRDLGHVLCYDDTGEPVVGCPCGYRLPIAEVRNRINRLMEEDRRLMRSMGWRG